MALVGSIGCASKLRVTSDPTRSTIYVKDPVTKSEVEIGQTPLEITTKELQKKLGKSPTENSYLSLEARHPDFVSEDLLVPFSRLLNLKTEIHLVLKPEEKNPISEQAKRLVEYLVSAQKLFNQGNAQEAMIQIEKALALDPQFEMALLFKGHLQYFQGKLQESLATYNSLIEIKPTHEEALKMIRVVTSKINQQGAR